jgi:CheY-like chemotaxis protein
MRSESALFSRVLVVEDDPVARELYAHFFQMRGFQVTTAATGAVALMILREEPDCAEWLVTKVDLPGDICGWLVAEEYRLLHPDRLVIFVSDRLAPVARSSARSFYLHERRPRDALIVLEVLSGVWGSPRHDPATEDRTAGQRREEIDCGRDPEEGFTGPNSLLRRAS